MSVFAYVCDFVCECVWVRACVRAFIGVWVHMCVWVRVSVFVSP